MTRPDERSSYRILATGATGFLGRHIVRALSASGHIVTPMGRDLKDSRTFPPGSFDLVMHAAAMVDKKFWESPDLFDVNVEGTRRLLDAYPEAKMVFISSADVERETLTPYARTKQAAEALVLSRSGSHLAVRPPSVFGPGDTHDKLIPRLFSKHLLGRRLTLAEGENEFMYVEDMAEQISAGLDRSGIWRLRGRTITNRELDVLVGTVCRRETPESLDEDALYFYRGLAAIRDEMEVNP